MNEAKFISSIIEFEKFKEHGNFFIVLYLLDFFHFY